MKKRMILEIVGALAVISILGGCCICRNGTKTNAPTPIPQRSTGTNVSKDTTTAMVPNEAVDTTSPGLIKLKWRTESEQDNYGFNLYRSLKKDGPWEKVNEKVVAGNGTTNEPHDYVYEDNKVLKNTTYYYQLEEVDYAGSAKRMPYTISGIDKKPVEKK